MTKTNVWHKIKKNINFVSLWKSFKYYDINRIINITYNNKKGIDKSMEEKRCLLCNKPYDYKYKMFGRGCLDNIYGVLEDILSTTLNNLAVVSSEYGVIKIYDLEIKFRTKEEKY